MFHYPLEIIPSLKQAKTSINVKFILDSACLSASLGDKGLFNPANILQIADVIRASFRNALQKPETVDDPWEASAHVEALVRAARSSAYERKI